MKKVITTLCVAALMIGCASKTEQHGPLTIKMEEYVDNTTQIKASQLGKSIRYVALETSDSATLVGANPKIKLYEDKLVVSSDKQLIKVFDAKTGKYINSIGELSRGNRGSLSLGSYTINPYNGEVYVIAQQPNEYHAYDIMGKYLRKITFPKLKGNIFRSAVYMEMLDQQTFVSHISNSMGGAKALLSIYQDRDTVAFDIPRPGADSTIGPDQIKSIAILKSETAAKAYGSASGDVMLISTSDLNQIPIFSDERNLWRTDNKVYFKEPYMDTVYQVFKDSITPVIYFDMGKYAVNYDDRFIIEEAKKHTSVSKLLGNNDVLYFEWSYNGAKAGLYDRESGMVTTANLADGIADDLNEFLPLTIHTTTPSGAFISLFEPLKVVEWAENNPSKKNQIPNLKEDDNIVVAIIE